MNCLSCAVNVWDVVVCCTWSRGGRYLLLSNRVFLFCWWRISPMGTDFFITAVGDIHPRMPALHMESSER